MLAMGRKLACTTSNLPRYSHPGPADAKDAMAFEVVIELMPQKPEPGIIVLTHSAKEEDLRRALAAGAKGVETCSAERAGANPGAHLPSPFGDHTFTGPDHQYLETA
jgi:CheY-like chemotaxis protein